MAPEDARGPDNEPAAPARFVRPYTITAGRTKAAVDLPMEATLRIQPRDASADDALGVGARRVLDLCDRRSVAEVSALSSMPIGVVRVLLGDLVQQGLVRVQATITESSSKDERIELIERTLRGLRSY
ncbi:MAG TPA: DUF742 domain-containing protein [Nocardioidaceae bacterium]